MSPESRQQRRARERKAEIRRENFDRIHGAVLAGRTILDMWRLYANETLTPHGIDPAGPEAETVTRPAFYAGAAAMFELLYRVSPDEISEEIGIEMLNRLSEELEIYVKRPRTTA